jgi:acetyltransferase-like isoleucine patch superfamily enzyme
MRHRLPVTLIAVIAMCLPRSLKRVVYNHALGWSVDPNARIGFSLIIAKSVAVGDMCKIGHFNLISCPGSLRLLPGAEVRHGNLIRGLSSVVLGKGSRISWLNWIAGPPVSVKFPSAPDRDPSFRLGDYSGLVLKHRIDCSDRVTIGDFSLMAGRRSYVLTHLIDAEIDDTVTRPVTIGHHCLLGAEILIQAGSSIPNKTVVAPRASVWGSPGEPEQLIGGVPAVPVKSYEGYAFFTRTTRRP